jgi:hypothetical protein
MTEEYEGLKPSEKAIQIIYNNDRFVKRYSGKPSEKAIRFIKEWYKRHGGYI